ncbi:Amino-acid acetyltransferase, mitochondrial [Nakaseomyces bracarensis]|uniref:Amino-acid acetyltransferase, mitochondrial n=1 Tax=Nakaseomyces bracarensis TaxID=273131 RepID=A0ABR4NVQ2_9SACH
MWSHLFKYGFRYEQQNSLSKSLIVSVLNSTATKREAKDYLAKYAAGSNSYYYYLLVVRGLGTQNERALHRLSDSIRRLKLLGISPVCVMLPSGRLNNELEIMDRVLTMAKLKPLVLNNGLSKRFDAQYESVLCTAVDTEYCAARGMVPVIMPCVYDQQTATQYQTKDPIKFMDYLSRDSSIQIDKFFILNQRGGIPSGERNQNSHIFINLSQEYKKIYKTLKQSLNVLNERQPKSEDLLDRVELFVREKDIITLEMEYLEHMENLQLMNTVLSNLPSTSTGVITTITAGSSPSDTVNPLVHNLLTDRSIISSSLPRFKHIYGGSAAVNNHNVWYEMPSDYEADEETFQGADSVFVTTVLKKGVDIQVFEHSKLTQYNSINLPEEFHTKDRNIGQHDKTAINIKKLDLLKFKTIIDKGFGRDLDLEHYLNRINGKIAAIIIIGDYEGIAILTYEGPSHDKFVYLDKFAVLPHLKGSLGISDIIFNLMFKKFPKEVVWRSRANNVVNKWYFQRSVAVIDLSIELEEGNQENSEFKMFYHGDPEASLKSIVDLKRLRQLAEYVRNIRPSWRIVAPKNVTDVK